MSQSPQSHSCNQLFASLPVPDQEHLAAAMRVERPRRGRILSRRNERSDEVWFPHTSLVSLGTTDLDGHNIQTALVGSEGCVGAETLLDRAPALADATVQIEGDMSVISAPRFSAALRTRPSIREAVLKHLYALAAQWQQVIACDRLHTLERRCCRAMLLMQDCVGVDELVLTQESLAALLGSGRPRVNTVLGSLERRGLLRCRRGRIRLLRRAALEEASCDCYRIVRRMLDSLEIPLKPLGTVA